MLRAFRALKAFRAFRANLAESGDLELLKVPRFG